MDIDDPLNEEGARSVFDFGGELNLREVIWLDLELYFLLTHSVVNLRCHLSDHLRVAHVERVGEDQLLGELLFVLSDSLLKGLVRSVSLHGFGSLDGGGVQL